MPVFLSFIVGAQASSTVQALNHMQTLPIRGARINEIVGLRLECKLFLQIVDESPDLILTDSCCIGLTTQSTMPRSKTMSRAGLNC